MAKTGAVIPPITGPLGAGIYAEAVDSAGNLWLGSNAGLSKFDGRLWTNYTRKPMD